MSLNISGQHILLYRGERRRKRRGEILLQSHPSWEFPVACFKFEHEETLTTLFLVFRTQTFSLSQSFKVDLLYFVFILK